MKRMISWLLVLTLVASILPYSAFAEQRETEVTSSKVIVPASVTSIDYGTYNDDSIDNIVILNPDCEVLFSDYLWLYEITFGSWQTGMYSCDFTLGTAVVHSPSDANTVTKVEQSATDHNCRYYSISDEPAHGNEFHGCSYIRNADGTNDLYCPICNAIQAYDVGQPLIGEADEDAPVVNGSYWSLDTETGILYISGEMPDFTASAPAPWYEYRERITAIEIADGVRRLGNYAFYHCENVQSVSIPDSMTSFGTDVFMYCTQLKAVTIPDGTQDINFNMFYSCRSLEKVYIPASVSFIATDAFSYCTGLKEITFGGSVEEVWGAFRDLTSLEIVRIAELSDWFEMHFDDNPFDIPNIIDEPPANPLYNGADLYVGERKVTDLVIPQGVTVLNEELFCNCTSITSVVLPSSVAEVGDFSLSCPNLTDVLVLNPEINLADGAFSGVKPTFHAVEGSAAQRFAGSFYPFHACIYIDNGDGTHRFYCPECKTVKLESMPHDPSGTCVCGYVTVCEHAYSSEVLTPPTCTENGEILLTCTVCGQSLTTTIGATGHDWSDWYVRDAAAYERVCGICNTVQTKNLVNPFTDIAPADYYFAPVLWAVDKGITNGMSETLFAPNEPCTRAQIVTFLYRAAGSPEPASTDEPFADVEIGAYYYKAVLWAVENGITTGMSETTFAPDAVCTRGQAVTFLCRFCGAESAGANPFADVAATDYFYQPVLWAVENGITMGVGGGRFAPDANCTRAQIVTFLYRAPKE